MRRHQDDEIAGVRSIESSFIRHLYCMHLLQIPVHIRRQENRIPLKNQRIQTDQDVSILYIILPQWMSRSLNECQSWL